MDFLLGFKISFGAYFGWLTAKVLHSAVSTFLVSLFKGFRK
jgi:hypothetical protein